MTDDLEKFYASKRFDTEHALDMIATSFVVIPAQALYDDEILEKYREITKKCHIYMIGLSPKIDFYHAEQDGSKLRLGFKMLGEPYVFSIDLPPDSKLTELENGDYIVITKEGKFIWPNMDNVASFLARESGKMNFEVLYIGQAYGDDGSRNAIDRLKNHETLQKIAVKGVPDGYGLNLLLLEIENSNRLIMMFNPWAKEVDENADRIQMGLDKLFETTEAERTTLYEASLIRYFQPMYNKVFKDSFPSTRLKTLADCYNKDISSVVAEICIDELPFELFSAAVEQNHYHIARHDLHEAEDRRVFFGGEAERQTKG